MQVVDHGEVGLEVQEALQVGVGSEELRRVGGGAQLQHHAHRGRKHQRVQDWGGQRPFGG